VALGQLRSWVFCLEAVWTGPPGLADGQGGHRVA